MRGRLVARQGGTTLPGADSLLTGLTNARKPTSKINVPRIGVCVGILLIFEGSAWPPAQGSWRNRNAMPLVRGGTGARFVLATPCNHRHHVLREPHVARAHGLTSPIIPGKGGLCKLPKRHPSAPLADAGLALAPLGTLQRLIPPAGIGILTVAQAFKRRPGKQSPGPLLGIPG